MSTKNKTYIEKTDYLEHDPANPGVHYHVCTYGLRLRDGHWFRFRRALELDVRLGFERLDRDEEKEILDIEARPEAAAILRMNRRHTSDLRKTRAIFEAEQMRIRAEREKREAEILAFVPAMTALGFEIRQRKNITFRRGNLTIAFQTGDAARWCVDINGRRQPAGFANPVEAAHSLSAL